VWRPRRLGTPIAERKLRFIGRNRRGRIVTVRFGLPVRTPRAQRRDPWWCPVQITGLGERSLRPIAGEDSLQSLILALEFVTRVLPAEASRLGGRLEWLGEREQLIFANTLLSGMASKALQNCVEGLTAALDILEDGASTAGGRSVARRLRALIASGGYTGDPRRVLSNRLTSRLSGPA
jgi:hypothetical protein